MHSTAGAEEQVPVLIVGGEDGHARCEPPCASALTLVTRAARGAARRPLHIESTVSVCHQEG
jgi:hypothetical protein